MLGSGNKNAVYPVVLVAARTNDNNQKIPPLLGQNLKGASS